MTQPVSQLAWYVLALGFFVVLWGIADSLRKISARVGRLGNIMREWEEKIWEEKDDDVEQVS